MTPKQKKVMQFKILINSTVFLLLCSSLQPCFATNTATAAKNSTHTVVTTVLVTLGTLAAIGGALYFWNSGLGSGLPSGAGTARPDATVTTPFVSFNARSGRITHSIERSSAQWRTRASGTTPVSGHARTQHQGTGLVAKSAALKDSAQDFASAAAALAAKYRTQYQ